MSEQSAAWSDESVSQDGTKLSPGSMMALSQGGEVEVFDYGDQIVVEVTFGPERENIAVESMELSGRELQIVLRERYS